jgi:hypothetical protein
MFLRDAEHFLRLLWGICSAYTRRNCMGNGVENETQVSGKILLVWITLYACEHSLSTQTSLILLVNTACKRVEVLHVLARTEPVRVLL